MINFIDFNKIHKRHRQLYNSLFLLSFVLKTKTPNALLSTRMGTYAQQGSIRKHHIEVHGRKLNKQEILAITTIIKNYPQKSDINLAEAFCIKTLNPTLNSQNDFSSRTLKIF